MGAVGSHSWQSAEVAHTVLVCTYSLCKAQLIIFAFTSYMVLVGNCQQFQSSLRLIHTLAGWKLRVNPLIMDSAASAFDQRFSSRCEWPVWLAASKVRHLSNGTRPTCWRARVRVLLRVRVRQLQSFVLKGHPCDTSITRGSSKHCVKPRECSELTAAISCSALWRQMDAQPITTRWEQVRQS